MYFYFFLIEKFKLWFFLLNLEEGILIYMNMMMIIIIYSYDHCSYYYPGEMCVYVNALMSSLMIGGNESSFLIWCSYHKMLIAFY